MQRLLDRYSVIGLLLIFALAGCASGEGSSGGSGNPPPNPVPAITSISPNTKTAGSAGFTLIVSGSGFVTQSRVLWNGVALTTTLENSAQLQSSVTASLMATAVSVSVQVSSPAPGGGMSNTLNLTVNEANGGSVSWNPMVSLPVNSGYVDTQTRQVVRVKSTSQVYICGLQAIGSGGSGTDGSYLTIYKGDQAGNPTSFTEQDAAHRPTNNSRINGVECRLKDGDTKIQIAYEDAPILNGVGAEKYIQFDTAANSWGTPETIGPISLTVNVRYHSKTALCLDSSGTPWITWGGVNVSTDAPNLSHRTGINAYSTETFTSGNAANISRITCAWDIKGALHLVWMENDSMPGHVYYRNRTAAGVYSARETVASDPDSTSLDDNGPSLVFDPADNNPVVNYLNNSPGPDPNYESVMLKRTSTNTWWAIFGVPTTIQGHSPAAYIDYQANVYAFMGHLNVAVAQRQPWVFERLGSIWNAGTQLANDGIIRDASANIRYDVLNPSSTTDIDFVTMIENYGSNNAQLMYVHGTPP